MIKVKFGKLLFTIVKALTISAFLLQVSSLSYLYIFTWIQHFWSTAIEFNILNCAIMNPFWRGSCILAIYVCFHCLLFSDYILFRKNMINRKYTTLYENVYLAVAKIRQCVHPVTHGRRIANWVFCTKHIHIG